MALKNNGEWKSSIYNPKEFRNSVNNQTNTWFEKPVNHKKNKELDWKSLFKLVAIAFCLFMIYTVSKIAKYLLNGN